MTTLEKLKFLRGLKSSDLPEKVAASVNDYLEIADSLDNDPELFAQLDGFDDDVEMLYKKVKDLGFGKESKKPTGKAKATQDRAMRAKSRKAGRSASTKKKAEKRAESKPKEAATPNVESKPKTTKKPQADKPAPKPKAEKAPTKAEEKQKARFREVRAEYKKWTAKVDEQDANLRKVIELVGPAVKGLGLTKLQLEIKQYEAYITILKKIYARDVRMQKTIMDKAKSALSPLEVKSLQNAIVKAQAIYNNDGMSGIDKTLRTKVKKSKKKKKKSSTEPKEEPKKGFWATVFS